MNPRMPINSTAYYLTKPYTFQKKREIIKEVPEDYTILKTVKTSICASDLHYYKGLKSEEKLRERLPLVLLHEGVCEDMRTGMKVIPVAGLLSDVPVEYKGKENLFPDLKYMGATMHGMARSHFLFPQELVIPLSPSIPLNSAAIAEPLSIVIKIIREMNIKYHNLIAVIGDGGMAYLLSLFLNHYMNIHKSQLTIYGIHSQKLEKMSEFGNTVNTRESDEIHPADIIFEIVGGKNIQATLDLAMKISKPGSILGMVGISDAFPGINVNKLVNQGITIKGLTRSTFQDFEKVADILKNEEISDKIINFIDPNEFSIQSEKDLKEAFEYASVSKKYGRIILNWE